MNECISEKNEKWMRSSWNFAWLIWPEYWRYQCKPKYDYTYIIVLIAH